MDTNTAPLDVEEFIRSYYANCPPRWRVGKTAANDLAVVRLDLAEKMADTNIDPFYNDSRLPLFEQWLRDNWNKP